MNLARLRWLPALLLTLLASQPWPASAGMTKEEVTAFKNSKEKAEKGDALAQYQLGLCYDRGVGVAKNLAQAAAWYRKAAETGYAEAQASLGFCYQKGLGVPADLAEAKRWYTRAASQGDANAQALLKELSAQSGR